MLQNYHFLPIWNKNIVYLYKRKVYRHTEPPDFSKVKVTQLSCNVASHKLRLTLLILHLPNGFALVVETYTLNQGGGSVDGVTNRYPILCLGGFATLVRANLSISNAKIGFGNPNTHCCRITISTERRDPLFATLQLCNFATLVPSNILN